MITNTRETGQARGPEGPRARARDAGLFNLQIDGTTDADATDVGDGGSTGEETLNTGDHTVGETAGTDTDLTDYAKSIDCKDDNGTGATVAIHDRRRRRPADRLGHDRLRHRLRDHEHA